jgi:DNA-binding transcriptional LysR family regulator
MNLLDPELLRTFIAVVDGGSLARAATTVGRSPSAVTAQMQRLEVVVGEPLLEAAGRGRTLTRAGEELVGHARKVIAAHREAWLAIKGARTDGHVRLAVTQDFTDSDLPTLLRDFAAAFARVSLELRIGRSGEMAHAFERSEIDVLVGMKTQPSQYDVGTIRTPMVWLAPRDGLVRDENVLPLALLDAPCGFRTAAFAALDRAGTPYRLAATSSSLGGLLTAVKAGMAVTLRTRRSVSAQIIPAPPSYALPEVGDAEFSVRLQAGASKAATELATLLCRDLERFRDQC